MLHTIKSHIEKALLALDVKDSIAFEVKHTEDMQHGDFASNVAMIAAKSLGTSPRELAVRIIQELGTGEDMPWSKIEIAGPGFINFFIKTESIWSSLLILTHEYPPALAGKKILLEYTSANMAKPFHGGHLRNTILGNAATNLLRATGASVITENYLGDWGTQFGKLMVAIERFGDWEKVKADPITEANNAYVRFHQEEENDPTLEDQARAYFARLDAREPEALEKWAYFREVSIEYLDRVLLKPLGTTFDIVSGESMYSDAHAEILTLLEKHDLLVHNEDGSIGIDFERKGINLPSTVIQKKDGTSLYFGRDVALFLDRTKKHKLDTIIHVVATDQELHFRQLIATFPLLGATTTVYHMAYGLFRLKEGKMSTRAGNVVAAEEILKEAYEKMRLFLDERNKQSDDPLSRAQVEQLAHSLSLSSVKYSMLRIQPQSEIVFDWDTVLAFQGDSAPYLLYTYARMKKLVVLIEDILPASLDHLAEVFANGEHASERQIVLLLMGFTDMVAKASETYRINLITQYLFDLANALNAFYQQSRKTTVLSDDERLIRKILLERSLDIMKALFEILGMEAVDRM